MIRYYTALIFLIVAFALAAYVPASFAQMLDVSSESVGTSTVLTVTNSNTSLVTVFSIWLDSGDFKSYKTGNNWAASINSAGILTFTASNPLESGTSAQFGIKTDTENFNLSWTAYGADSKVVSSGTIKEKPVSTIKPTPSNPDTVLPIPGNTSSNTDDKLNVVSAITSDTKFRIIPEQPNAGATIRVLADGMSAGHDVDFYIDGQLVGQYIVSDDGRILETVSIPDNLASERSILSISDSVGNSREVNTRVGTAKIITTNDVIETISISGPSEIKASDVVEFSGTAAQNSHVVITTVRPDGAAIESKIINVDTVGVWKHDVLVPSNMPAGVYTVKATNGRTVESQLVTVVETHTIDISPTRLKFEPGDIMSFVGTVQKDHPVDVVITDPRNREVYVELLHPDPEGQIIIKFKTELSDVEGTYVLFVTQNSETVVVLGGLGEFAAEKILLRIDKLNYRNSESVKALIDGEPNSHVTIIVLNDANRQISSKHIEIGPSGKLDYVLDLSSYTSGVYTMVVTKATTEAEAQFGVNIAYASGTIEIKSTKTHYIPGSEVLVLGSIDSVQPVLINMSLIDPNGEIIQSKELFSRSGSGKISDSFRIALGSTVGTWTVRAQSGDLSSTDTTFVVIESMGVGSPISVEVLDAQIPHQLRMAGTNINSQLAINLQITPEGSDEVLGTVTASVTLGGTYEAYWQIPSALQPGIYTVTADYTDLSTEFLIR